MELDSGEWQLVSDPFEDWRLHQHVTPLIDEPQVGSVTLIIAVERSKPPILLACHTMNAFSIHLAELKLMKGEDIVTLGDCELLKAADSEGFITPPLLPTSPPGRSENQEIPGSPLRRGAIPHEARLP